MGFSLKPKLKGAVRLDNIRIDEVSGVDDPANCTPGWLLTKAAGLPRKEHHDTLVLTGRTKIDYSKLPDPIYVWPDESTHKGAAGHAERGETIYLLPAGGAPIPAGVVLGNLGGNLHCKWATADLARLAPQARLLRAEGTLLLVGENA